MRSLAAITRRPGDRWTVVDIEVDDPGPGEVLVEWRAAGLCHSDEHFRNGERVPPDLVSQIFPFLGGHEGAGVVAAVGAGVDSFARGDHVLGSFAPTCGVCSYCASGRGHLCNANRDYLRRGQAVGGDVKHRVDDRDLYLMAKLGTFAERTVVAAASLVKIAEDIPFEVAALLSCGVATGFGSAVQRAGTRPGDVVAVVGLGGLGIAAVQGARIAGARAVLGIDPFALRQDAALKLGATHAFDSIVAAVETIAGLTNGQGAERVILTPSIVTGDLITEGLAITGKDGVCVVTGMGPLGETQVSLDIGAFALWSKELRGCLFGSFDPRSASSYLLSLYRTGQLDVEAMISKYPLEAIDRALEDSLEGRNVRAVVTMGD